MRYKYYFFIIYLAHYNRWVATKHSKYGYDYVIFYSLVYNCSNINDFMCSRHAFQQLIIDMTLSSQSPMDLIQ